MCLREPETIERLAAEKKKDAAVIRAWFCTHRNTIGVGDKRAHWEMYCNANRRCVVGDEGCHEIVVTEEWLAEYEGEVFGSLL